MFEARTQRDFDNDAQFQERVRHGVARFLFEQAARANLGVVVISVIYVLSLFGHVSTVILLCWLGIQLGLVLIRLSILRRFLAWDHDQGDFRPWVRKYSLVTGILGLSWAMIPTYFYGQVESWQLSLTLFITAGVMAAGIPVLAAHLPSMLAYVTPLALGGLYQALVAEPSMDMGLIFAVFIYWLFMVGAGKQQHDILVESMKLRFQQERLVTDLRETGKAAEAASEAKSRFLAKVSHEIRTPMNGILGVTELLDRTALDQRQRRLTDIIRRSADGLMHLINDLLDLSKIEAGRLEIAPEDFDLKRCAQDLVELFEPAASAKGIALYLHMDDNIPAKLHGDWRRLQQALTNLISNAVKFTDHGQIELRMTRKNVEGSRHTLRFSVSDTGIGISTEDTQRIFAPFVQVDDSATRRYAGTGLGLAIARQLIAEMGGEIHVESALGDGARFFFELAFTTVQEPATESQPKSTETSNHGLGCNVLLAEDNPINQMVTQEMLELLHCQMTLVENGLQAVEMAKQQSFDAILIDRHMPMMDGFTAARRIREHETQHGLPPATLIAVTASAYPSDRRDAEEAGIDGFLTKPFTFEQLREILLGASRNPQDKTRPQINSSGAG